jgi:mono/diheme cytochrome c family protein
MRFWRWIAVGVIVIGIGAAVFMLRPVNGPPRDLGLAVDATRGAYLIRLGGCVSCHTDTANGGALLAGGPPLATAFGTFHAPNITPHPDVGIGNWTIEQFARAMSDGEGPDGHLYPVFPYENYTRMSDQDIVDLFAGLQQVQHQPNEAPEHEVIFPFNLRPALAGWKNLFFRPARFVEDDGQSDVWNRGAYLANGPGHCVACHSPRNFLGAIEAGRELTGNAAGGPGGRTPPITREALRAEGYDMATLMDALKSGFTPNFDVLGGAMGEVVRDSTSQWTDEDLTAVATYLMGDE